MKKHSIAAAMIAAAIGLGTGIAPNEVPRALPAVDARQTRRQRRLSDASRLDAASHRKRGPGWTHAQVQRMARKAKNRRRNRAAHR